MTSDIGDSVRDLSPDDLTFALRVTDLLIAEAATRKAADLFLLWQHIRDVLADDEERRRAVAAHEIADLQALFRL